MKLIILVSFLAGYTTCMFAQTSSTLREKPVIDTGTFDEWLSVKPTWVDARIIISNDGNYALYKVREHWSKPGLIIQAINGDWKEELSDVENAEFTDDSRKAVFIQSSDSLCLLTLGNSSIEYIPHVRGFRLFKQGNAEWLAYTLNTTTRDLVLYNLKTGKKQSFAGVSEYLLSRDGTILVMKTESKKDSMVAQSLNWIDLPDGKSKVIWEGSKAGNWVLDASSTQLAFRIEDKDNGQTEISFWYYRRNADKAIRLANGQSVEIDNNLQLDRISGFNKDGSKLLFYLKEKDVLKPNPDVVKVDVWSYTDAKLQPQQLSELRLSKSYIAALSLNNHHIIRLQKEYDTRNGGDNSGFLYVSNRKGEDTESYWNTAARSISYIVSLDNGERRQLKINFIGSSVELSSDNKYLIGLDETRNNYYSYEIQTGIIHNITKALPVPVLKMIERDNEDRPIYKHSRGLWFVAWMTNGDALIQDEFDIWQIDPEGKKAAVCLTNHYGRRNKIEFRLAGIYEEKTIPIRGELILSAFNRNNKEGGFYKVILDKKQDPQLLSMEPYYYDPGYNGRAQVKARDAEVYVVMRESTAESPNYFWTRDFKTFAPLSSVYPEKKYNWLTGELVSFTTMDNRTEQGVLYKPENFDPRKKYPVIIHYYERKSQDLNKYHKPAEPNGELDIAWFVSRGYLVFTPDIHFRIGKTGQSAFNSVVGAAKYLTRFPWVDAKHMGIQGHSFGGYETNYIVTRTNLFAAAMSSSGMSDFVSGYGQLMGNVSKQYFMEVWQNRLGTGLLEAPDLYINNSPVFKADKITTPMLTMANKRDVNVSWLQGIEWFTILRRLGKRIWMLQYDEESHGVSGKNYKDYVIRMTQFFDHYLKGAPPPKWMTRGIPAKMKGIDNGLELDDEIKTPGPGLLIEQKVDK